MEYLVLGVFCAGLLLCIAFQISILYVLAFGLILFMLYGKHKGFSWHELLQLALTGVKTVRNILITFVFIGIMTALWRASGTIAFIVCHSAKLIRPSVYLLMTFLLNSAISVLTGTSFGTAATMGIICAAMGTTMNVSPVWTGGAVLSGVYFGDRCSPVSTSALLVATVTRTDIYDNIRRMIRSSSVPFLLTCLIYLAIGFTVSGEGSIPDLQALYSRTFQLNIISLLPAVVILLLSVLHVNVKTAMGASILAALPVCIFVQGISFPEIFKIAFIGFYPEDAEVAALISGGGIISMLNVACIVCISSAYSDIFLKTGLLDGPKHAVSAITGKTTVFAATLVSSIVTGMIACSQTLTILLTDQLCKDMYSENGQLALDLEDTAVVVAPLIPWSIAGAVPLAAASAPAAAILTSFYLLLLPLYRLLTSAMEESRKR